MGSEKLCGLRLLFCLEVKGAVFCNPKRLQDAALVF